MRIKLGILILLVWSLGVACGGDTPRSVVEQALEYQIAHPIGVGQEVLGLAALQEQVDLTGVKIKTDRPLTLPGEQGPLAARHLEGTYTLRVDPEGERRYFRRQQPFQLTLAEREEEPIWVLATPSSGVSGSGTAWTTLEFLPAVESPSAGSELSEQASGNVSADLSTDYKDRSPQQIPLGPSDQRFSAPNS